MMGFAFSALWYGRRAHLCHTAPLFFAHCDSCGLRGSRAYRGKIQAPASKTAAVYHPPHGRIQVLRGDRLLDPDNDSEWVFYAYESRPKDDGPVGWYHESAKSLTQTVLDGSTTLNDRAERRLVTGVWPGLPSTTPTTCLTTTALWSPRMKMAASSPSILLRAPWLCATCRRECAPPH